MLEISDLSFSFGQQVVLKDISIRLDQGKVYGILGKNGAGKTTLFRNITGWYPPQSGKILLNGMPVGKKDIAFLETTNYFYPYMKGQEYLDLINEHARERGASLAEVLQVPLDELVDTYSTGMKKKLAFIGALILDRPLLLLDEPFNGVDLESNEVLKRLILLNRTEKTTLMSSHILSTLFDSCDTIFYLREGLVKSFERPAFSELEKEIQEGIAEKMDHYIQLTK